VNFTGASRDTYESRQMISNSQANELRIWSARIGTRNKHLPFAASAVGGFTKILLLDNVGAA
jgi:hypothetical protein